MDLMDEKTLRAKRGIRKGIVTKITSSYLVRRFHNLKRKIITMKKVNALDENIEAFEQIQEQMELHSEKPPSEEKEKELDKWRLMAEELRSDLSALLQAREAYNMAKSIEHIIKDLEDAHSLTGHIVKESIRTM